MTEQDRVRRLLGDLRATDDAAPPAMPAELAARLEEQLAALTDSPVATAQETEPQVAPVVPLRRRLAPVLVAAALALVVGGAAVGLQQGSGGDSGGDSAGSEAAGGSVEAPSAAQEESAPESLDAPRGGADDTGGRMTPAPYLTAADLSSDVRALVRRGEVATGTDPDQDATERARVEGSGCAVPDDDLGAATLVSLDGEPAVLVVAPVDSDQQVVAVLDCLGREVGTTAVPTS